MNDIWDCKIYLKMPNPNARSKIPFLKGDCECLIILDKDKEIVDSETNKSVIRRTISKKIGGHFSIEHIIDTIPIKKIGRSQATS